MATPVLIELTHFGCWKCGIVFAVPAAFLGHRRADNRGIYCPCGHRNHFTQKPPSDAEAELRKALMRHELKAIHDREQAEAKAAESAPASA